MGFFSTENVSFFSGEKTNQVSELPWNVAVGGEWGDAPGPQSLNFPGWPLLFWKGSRGHSPSMVWFSMKSWMIPGEKGTFHTQKPLPPILAWEKTNFPVKPPSKRVSSWEQVYTHTPLGPQKLHGSNFSNLRAWPWAHTSGFGQLNQYPDFRRNLRAVNPTSAGPVLGRLAPTCMGFLCVWVEMGAGFSGFVHTGCATRFSSLS